MLIRPSRRSHQRWHHEPRPSGTARCSKLKLWISYQVCSQACMIELITADPHSGPCQERSAAELQHLASGQVKFPTAPCTAMRLTGTLLQVTSSWCALET